MTSDEIQQRRHEETYSGLDVVVMGLGLHGGGLEATRYLARHGAKVTVTDMRDEKVLAPSIEKLEGLPIRYVLGRHELDDFKKADFVVKNPAVLPNSPFLTAARRVETDMSIFLEHCPASLIAVTGSKGKSSTSSAIRWGLERAGRRAFLGGNITVSPLSFLDELRPDDEVVLELSSWQLGDLRGRTLRGDRRRDDGSRALLKPRVAVITAIMMDHLDRYKSMEAYVADKRLIYAGQESSDATVVSDDAWGKSFAVETRGRPIIYSREPLPEGVVGGWLAGAAGPARARRADGSVVEIVPPAPLTPGSHQKQNLLTASLALLDLGIAPRTIYQAMGTFPGIEHRLEFFHEWAGIRFYNDTAATIPEAAVAAIDAFERSPVIVAGGTDKELDFTPLAAAARRAKAIVLLAGSGSAKLATMLDREKILYKGPFNDLDEAVKTALSLASAGDTVVLSPGCASFGMFLNEFDRGRKWKEAIARLAR